MRACVHMYVCKAGGLSGFLSEVLAGLRSVPGQVLGHGVVGTAEMDAALLRVGGLFEVVE